MGGTISDRRRSIWSIKEILRAIALVGVIWVSLVGIVASRRTTLIISHNKYNMKHPSHDEVIVGQGKIVAHWRMDIIYTSKRKVPNGPDPIHNRRAANSRRSPGQA